VVGRNKCEECVLFKQATSWIGTPFKFRDCAKGRGADCVSAPLSVWVDSALLSRETFLKLYSAHMLSLFRRNQQEFLNQLEVLLGDGYKLDISEKSVKCGDVVIRTIGRYREMFTAIYVSGRFLVAQPDVGVQWINVFEFDYKISKIDFQCPCKLV